MPVVAHSQLPTFLRLMEEGDDVLTQARAEHQDIRELHIGFLNMMPDAALVATERQFFRLVGACNRIAQFYIHPFSFAEISRGEHAQTYIDRYYERFEDIKQLGLDALIISGANPVSHDLTQECFWQPLTEVIAWAQQNVTSVLCACLATHAAVQHLYAINRVPLKEKRWGVFSHQVVDHQHPLVRNINTRFDVPHSRWNEMSREQCQIAGLPILVESRKGGIHLATSPDGLRFVFFQGHPEYDRESLLKEYKRELGRYLSAERADYPPLPVHYIGEKGKAYLAQFQDKALKRRELSLLDDFSEVLVMQSIDNTWNDTGKIVINNWLGLVYQLTHPERNKPFMVGVDSNNPLGLLR